jgi:uncharacterized protein with HEPN domain
VRVGGGEQLTALSLQVEKMALNAKLEMLGKTVEQSLPSGSKGSHAYIAWLDQAHKLRKVRNELVHGRWDVDPERCEALNIIGIPTSPEQREVRYTLADLQAHVAEIERLSVALNELRRRWQL